MTKDEADGLLLSTSLQLVYRSFRGCSLESHQQIDELLDYTHTHSRHVSPNISAAHVLSRATSFSHTHTHIHSRTQTPSRGIAYQIQPPLFGNPMPGTHSQVRMPLTTSQPNSNMHTQTHTGPVFVRLNRPTAHSSRQRLQVVPAHTHTQASASHTQAREGGHTASLSSLDEFSKQTYTYPRAHTQPYLPSSSIPPLQPPPGTSITQTHTAGNGPADELLIGSPPLLSQARISEANTHTHAHTHSSR